MQTQHSLLNHDLVLLGGGHSHALVLLQWAMNPLPGIRVTLISENSDSPYSGMLPGLVAGHYDFDDVHIDLRKLCRHAGARFIKAQILGIDLRQQTITLLDRPALAYDTLSINVGATPDLSVEGAKEYTIPVKPISQFWPAWLRQKEQLQSDHQARDIAVVGGGAGSAELVLAMAHALRHESVQHRFHLVSRGERLLPGYPKSTLQWLERRLQAYAIQLHLQADIVRTNGKELLTSQGEIILADTTFWCTQARAVSWIGDSQFDVTNSGFLRVHPTLQSLRWPSVFAAGDCAWIDETPTARAGVYAVRQAPILFHNLRQHILGQPLKPYRPQTRFLSLIATGAQHAVGARGRIPLAGKWVWRWKDRIDRRFMTMLQQLPIMPPPTSTELNSLESASMRCGGCGSKVGANVLQQALSALDEESKSSTQHLPPTRDDAAIISLDDDLTSKVLVQSVDTLKPLLDDPYLTGRITTLHALSDLYAMHATAHSAQLQVQLPLMQEQLQIRDMQQILQGVQHELHRAGATLVGGHTLEADSLSLGLTVNGFALRHTLLKKSGAQVGDALILTKPLGSGTLFAAAMRGAAKARWIDNALPLLLQSNSLAAQIIYQHNAHALTDVTGFGLAGHLGEMLTAAHIGATLELAQIPTLEGALDCIAAGYHSTLAPANRRAQCQLHREDIQCNESNEPRYELLFDPQTQGGLLAAIPIKHTENCLQALRQHQYQAAVIGTCVAGTGIKLRG